MTDLLALLKEARDWIQQQTNWTLCDAETKTVHPMAVRLEAAIAELEDDPQCLKVLLPNLPVELVTLSGPLRLAAIEYGRECIRLLRQHGLSQRERKCGTCEYHRGCDVQLAHVHETGATLKDSTDWFCADWQPRGGKDE